MKLIRYAPMQDLLTLEDRFNRIFGGLLPRWNGEAPAGTREWEPLVDIHENEKEFVLKAELPEVAEKDVHVNVEGNLLTITGERKRDEEVKEGQYHRTERFYGAFARTFVLPETVDNDQIRATYKDGVMRLVMPKKEAAKPRQIRIESGK